MTKILIKLFATPLAFGSAFTPLVIANEQTATQTKALSLSEITKSDKL
jgi:hypothetical protein